MQPIAAAEDSAARCVIAAQHSYIQVRATHHGHVRVSLYCDEYKCLFFFFLLMKIIKRPSPVGIKVYNYAKYELLRLKINLININKRGVGGGG